MTAIVRSLSAEVREQWLKSWMNLWRFNLLQPDQAMQRDGAEARRKEWHRHAGGRSGEAKWGYIAAGAVMGFVAGLVLGLQVPWVSSVLVGLAAAPLGGYGGNLMSRTGSFYDGMVLIVANERRSRIRKEMVTAQSRVWVPKLLVVFRAQDWRYVKGRPYLWLRLPYGVRIHQALNGTASYLGLPDDFYRAKDAAVYAQRAWNRMIAQNGDDYAVLDEPEPERKLMAEIGPWIGAGIILIAGLLMFVMTLD